jgi:hypothetical protein
MSIFKAIPIQLKTAFITKQEQEYLSICPRPDVIADNLVAAANKIINFA